MKVVTGNGEFELGTTETTPTIGLTDYSRRVTDDFGVTTVVERGFSRRMSVKLGLPFDSVDAVQRRLSDLRAEPALWVADDRFVWLSLYGFYKDFDLDLASPPLSWCTLSIDGLAETGGVTDNGADPALGQASTLQLLQPTPVTDTILAGSLVAENDAPEWASGTGYTKGARVIRASTHRVYESLITGNTGRTPETEPAWWLDLGPTNRWAMFDEALGTATTRNGGVEVTLNGGTANAVSLIDLGGDAVRVRANGYDQTQAVRPGAMTFTGLPGSGQVIVTVSGAQAAVGTLLIGRMVGLGVTEAAPTAGITDFSRKETDGFGSVSVVQRGYLKRMTARALIRTDAVDLVADRMAAVRARPSLWIGQSGVDAITVYGFVKDFEIEVGIAVSKLSLTVEGLTKAAPAVPAAVTLVPRGPYNAATIYAAGALVEDQGVTWRYINATATAGYAPPKLPTTSNAFWQVFSSTGMTPDQQQDLADAIARVAALGSDNVLSAGSEKQAAIIDWNTLYQDLESLYAKYVALGSPIDLQAPLAAATAARTALGSYLGNLAPPWNQISTDTAIVSAEWSSKWTDAYQRINDFRAQITGRKGDPGASGASAFKLINVGNFVFPTPDSLNKVSGTTDWDGKARTDSFSTGGAVISATVLPGTFVGLTTDPAADLSFGSIDYGLHLSGDGGHYSVWRNGTAVWNSATMERAPLGLGAQRLTVVNDGKIVRYLIDGVGEITSHPVNAIGETIYGVFAQAPQGIRIYDVKWQPGGIVGQPGSAAPLLRVQWSIDGVSNWHDNYFGADIYQRQSNDNGATWGPAYRVVGENGTIGQDGSFTSFVFRRSATVPAAPGDNTGNPPSGWTDAPPAGTDFLWQSKATFRAATQLTSWSAPVRISGEKGTDGFVIAALPPFSIPVFPTGTPKTTWTGGTGVIRLYKGDGEITGGVSYAVEGAVNMVGLTISGQTFSFASISADAGYFTIVATYAGISYRSRVDAKKVYDGSAAFRANASIPQASGSTFSGSGTTAVPGGSTVRVSGGLFYGAPDPRGTYVTYQGRITLYYRNVSTNGPLTALGTVDGSLAYTRNRGTATEPDYEMVDGSVAAAFNFTASAGDAIYEFSAQVVNAQANPATVTASGSVGLGIVG